MRKYKHEKKRGNMFFVNSDLKNKTEQKNLRGVINDSDVKVAYGVLSLISFYKMVKRLGDSEKIYIPKVQRGLVWKIEDKSHFMKNCILGKEDNIREPMPNIFLFCDSQTNEIQLFDGLQRTSAILREFETVDDILPEYDIMIPAALFKGTRSEAENLFRNINDKGIKLNDFEKLASYGGRYEINDAKLTDDFKEKFQDFVNETTKQYNRIGLQTSKQEVTTIYEILTYAIYSFSKSSGALKIFPKKDDESFIKEWGFQVAYSTTTKRKSKEYQKKFMIPNLLSDFAEKINYNPEDQTINEELLSKYIEDIIEAIHEASASLKDIYEKNVISNNKEYINKAALKSKALVSSVVSVYYLYPDHFARGFMTKWFLLQLISGRAEKNTNKIIDELINCHSKTIEDLETETSQTIKNIIESNPTAKTHTSWLWILFHIHYKQITKCGLSTQFEIDHIIPRSKLKKAGISIIDANNIGNLVIIKKTINRQKSNIMLSDFIDKVPMNKDEIIDTLTFNVEKSEKIFEELINTDKDIKNSMENGEDTVINYYDIFIKKRIKEIKKIL